MELHKIFLWTGWIAVFLFFLSPTPTYAQSVHEIGPNYFGAGIPSEEFEYYASPRINGRQRQENWCWAACIQMVLNYHGINVHQEEVVARVYGELVDQPGTPTQVLEALSGWAPTYRGDISTIYSEYGVYAVADIINNLAGKWPLIIGLRNPGHSNAHALVMTAIYYQIDPVSQHPIVEKVVLRDPYPDHPSRQEMSWDEFLEREPIFFKVWTQKILTSKVNFFSHH